MRSPRIWIPPTRRRWFYDAIRLQLANQPVSALRELEQSIALNDNRAPFRSRLLLDRDQATRGASLAQIYQDLGFTQLGINEAGRALMLDPASSSAHRFLAGVYQGEPRLEAARVSELLQSQLLQPVGMNPVQPSLGFADLNVIANAGPAHVGFNEFTPLFQQDGWQINGTGVVGTQNTIGNELTATALWGRTSVSVGQYYFDTDGFRANDNLQHKIYSMFGQVQATDNLGLQAEYRRRETNAGDRTLNFDPDDFRRNFDREHRPGSVLQGGRQAGSVARDVRGDVGGAWQQRPTRPELRDAGFWAGRPVRL